MYGRSASNYTVLSATNVSAPVWVPAASFTLTNSFRYLTLPSTNNVIFYRLRRN